MIRDAEHIQVSELYRLFVFDPSSMVVRRMIRKFNGG